MTMTTGEPPHYGPRGHSVPAPTATTIPTGVCGTSMPPLTISIVNMWLVWWPILTWRLTLTSSGTCFTPSQVGSNKPHNSCLNYGHFSQILNWTTCTNKWWNWETTQQKKDSGKEGEGWRTCRKKKSWENEKERKEDKKNQNIRKLCEDKISLA